MEKERIFQLRKELHEHGRRYYDEDAPIISDYEYDKLMGELRRLEAKHPEMYDPNSPTVKVGGAPASKFSKFPHNVPLQSLIDVFDLKDVDEWVKEVLSEYPGTTFSVEAKIDGLSLSLTYDNGRLVTGATRGNGLVGEVVTENVLQIPCIPAIIPDKGHHVFRGEVFMSRKRFAEINEERLLNGEVPLANCRNAAAGTLRQNDAAEVAQRGLECLVFNIQESSQSFETHSSSLEYAKSQGMPVTPYVIASTVEEVRNAIEEIGCIRGTNWYDTDGAVVKVNELHVRDELGVTAKYPKWAIAYKYPPDERTTVVRDIKLQVGRTGVITPKAVFDTVQLGGTNVSAATLHNFDVLNTLDIRIGDTVRVYKAGEIIPKITGVILEKRPGTAVKFEAPDKCPVCGSPTKKDDEGAALRCTNPDCAAKFVRKLIHFVHKDCMNIDGMGGELCNQLCESGLVTRLTDVYSLTKDKLLTLEGVGEKKAENLLRSIENSRKVKLTNFLYSFGIPLFGHKATELVSAKCGSLEAVLNLSADDMADIPGIGSAIADSACSYFKDHRSGIEELAGFMEIEVPAVQRLTDKYTGKKCVVTGSFDKYSRRDIENALKLRGAVVSGSVSKNTDFLFCGQNAGSKLEKAKTLGVCIIEDVEELF